MKDKALCPHVLALRSLYTEHPTKTDSWNGVLATLSSMRKKHFAWARTLNRGPSRSIREWIKKTPVLYEWALSDQCLSSPQRWPEEVYPAFSKRLIPSPYEIANVDMLGLYAQNERAFKNYLVLLLYCMGFTVEQISTGYQTSRQNVIRIIFNAVENLQDLPQYIIWATATDFSSAILPSIFSFMSLHQKLELMTKLRSNPFDVPTTICASMLESPSYLTYLIYSSPKQIRLTAACRLYRTGECPNVS